MEGANGHSSQPESLCVAVYFVDMVVGKRRSKGETVAENHPPHGDPASDGEHMQGAGQRVFSLDHSAI